MCLKKIVIFTLMLLSVVSLFAKAPDKSISEWEEAATIAREHRTVWREQWASLDVDSRLCEAIVFPELMRYVPFRNQVEKAALLALYVQNGKEKANFSVGMFQMKPSFAEEVEHAWMHSGLRHEYQLYFDLRSTKEVRRQRIARLDNDLWQCVYLALFVRLMIEREPSLAEMEDTERLKLLATAYNHSFSAPLETLKQRETMKSFHLDLVATKSTTFYSYADLAAYYYKTIPD